MEERIYIVGHKNPDLDSVVSAVAYQHYKQKNGNTNYLSVVHGTINPITEWVFKRFKQEIPPQIESISGKNVVFVDHTEPEQRAKGWENANILEIIDHREADLQGISTNEVVIKNYGSTATIIAEKYIKDNIQIEPLLASLILSAILDDTLALKSPNTTIVDEKMAAEMAAIAEIGDIDDFSRELLKEKDSWHSMSAADILKADKKEFQMANNNIVISQIETMDGKKMEKREGEFVASLELAEKEQDTSLRLLMITDLVTNICTIIGVGQKVSDLEEIFGKELVNDRKIYLPNVLSRKTQVIPPILSYYSRKNGE